MSTYLDFHVIKTIILAHLIHWFYLGPLGDISRILYRLSLCPARVLTIFIFLSAVWIAVLCYVTISILDGFATWLRR